MIFIKCLQPTLSQAYVACARAYALDTASCLLLFFCGSVMTGRVWRFPFDDETYTLSAINSNSVATLTAHIVTGDVHPPLSYLFFYALLHYLGLGESAMRLCSLVMTALALTLFHLLALTLIARRGLDAVPFSTRLIAVLLFGLCPLAISQGDALRWYPLFAMLISLFVILYLVGGNNAARLWSAVPLGIAASTSLLSAIVIPPFILYRYALQRQFRASFDLIYWSIVLCFGSLGIFSAYWLFVNDFNLVGTQLINGIVQAALTDLLGFFGGGALGISQAWIIVPTVVVSAIAAFSETNRKDPANPVHLFLLMLAATVVIVVLGFNKPRSFLYLAPVLAVVLTLFLDRQTRERNAGFAVLLIASLLACPVGAIANLKYGTRPFKRNMAIPYQSIVDFIRTNEKGRVLIVSTDPVIPWVLRHQYESRDRCVTYFVDPTSCLATDQLYETVFVITGHSDKDTNFALMREFNSAVYEMTAKRRKAAIIHAGVDEDADIKTWLTGVPLDKYIISVDLYQ
jgi:hypothetical protein